MRPTLQSAYFVRAIWDDEARVWISDSDIPGLVIEAESLAEFEDLMLSLAPEMLADNVGVHGVSVPVDFSVQARRDLAVA